MLTWLTKPAQVWEAVCGLRTFPYPRAGKALKPLVLRSCINGCGRLRPKDYPAQKKSQTCVKCGAAMRPAPYTVEQVCAHLAEYLRQTKPAFRSLERFVMNFAEYAPTPAETFEAVVDEYGVIRE